MKLAIVRMWNYIERSYCEYAFNSKAEALAAMTDDEQRFDDHGFELIPVSAFERYKRGESVGYYGRFEITERDASEVTIDGDGMVHGSFRDLYEFE